jgi:uncharacterized membrane protein
MAEKHPHPHASELEREFELERMILFSDAIFAIAITLMVIDVKWPDLPEELKGVDLRKALRPTTIQLFIFVISFLFVGRAWKVHLRLFRQLKTYNELLLNLNLLYLFFIVLFPFTASGMIGKVRDGFGLPFLFYVFNMMGVAVTDFLITRYIFKVKPSLATQGNVEEKQFIFTRARYNAIIPTAVFCFMLLVVFMAPGNTDDLAYAFCGYPVALFITNRKIKKLKPKTTT